MSLERLLESSLNNTGYNHAGSSSNSSTILLASSGLSDPQLLPSVLAQNLSFLVCVVLRSGPLVLVPPIAPLFACQILEHRVCQ